MPFSEIVHWVFDMLGKRVANRLSQAPQTILVLLNVRILIGQKDEEILLILPVLVQIVGEQLVLSSRFDQLAVQFHRFGLEALELAPGQLQFRLQPRHLLLSGQVRFRRPEVREQGHVLNIHSTAKAIIYLLSYSTVTSMS